MHHAPNHQTAGLHGMNEGMTREELAAWLQLVQAKGIGHGTVRRLLAAFGLPQQILAQSTAALEQLLSAKQIAALRTPDAETLALIETTWQWLQQGGVPVQADTHAGVQTSSSEDHSANSSKNNSINTQQSARAVQRRIVTLGDPAYPSVLLEMADPPVLLYAMGQVECLQQPQPRIAMVGSRNPTPQGASNARAFGKAFAEMGWTVVSGLALGVDGAAHEGALQAALPEQVGVVGLATIAVVGTGLDRVYPRQHRDLAHRIVQHGVILSESPLGTPPLSHHFPKRNRIIAGLSHGVLVVEAALQSGSLITARLAGEQGKEVFAIPGSIHAPQSRGCHALIKQGAKLVESAQDVLEELRTVLPAGRQAVVSSIADKSMEHTDHGVAADADSATAPIAPTVPGDTASVLLQALGHDPVGLDGLDALLARTGLDAATLQAKLLELELMGMVGRLPGGLFQRIGTA